MTTMAAIPTTYDKAFSPIAGIIPVAFLRALAYNESSLNPNEVTKNSNATGLFQITQTVLNDYNLQHGTKYKLADVKDPNLNAKIGVELITRIVKNYQTNHPRSLAMNWKDPRYVQLLVQGYNAGYSEANGVGFVVGNLEKKGVQPAQITVDAVAKAAPGLKASRFLSMPQRVSYAKAVANTYFNELAIDNAKAKPPAPLVSKAPKAASNTGLFGNAFVALLFPLVPMAGVVLANAINKAKKHAKNLKY